MDGTEDDGAVVGPVEPVGDEMLKGMNEGWSQSLERLGALLAQSKL
ncbi:MAG: hypothetical protein WD039_09175 [Xanthobacteraceae bacterium]